MLNKPHLRKCILAVALASMPVFVQAAGLGRLNVLSGLGQPFRGEIELVSVQPGEIETLAVRLASVESYAAAQLAYPDPVLGLRLVLERREGGSPIIRISSAGAVDEPVFNLLVDLSWVGGRIQREYTALLDPAGYSSPVAASRSGRDVLPGRSVSSVIQPPQPAVAPTRSVRPVVSAPADKYSVKAGDTLSSIARAVRPEGVSLEQVIVGLYRANPDAFSSNMNRLKRGRILHIPEADQLAAVNQKAAVREIRAHSADWQGYRRQLSEAATRMTAADAAGAASGGRITAQVEDKAASQTGVENDVLKLSKGEGKVDNQAGKVQALEEEVVARKKALEEASQRVAELQKNIEKMEALAALQSQTGAAVQQKAEQDRQDGAASAVIAAPVASAPQEEKPKPKRVPPPPPPPEPSLMDVLMDNALPVGGGLAAVLLGVAGLLWSRKRRRPEAFENSLITSGDLKPNTVLGKTGGGVISTQAENSFLTDFSRQGLGTIDTDEVDPIAEADVYMAYGRDAQAEEILKDALLKEPERQEIRLKLLDIYAARKDKIAFEEIAADLFAATAGKGPLWEQAAFHGRNLDPENALYAQKGLGGAAAQASSLAAAVGVAATAAAVGQNKEMKLTEPSSPEAVEVHAEIDFEFEIPEDDAAFEQKASSDLLQPATATSPDADLESWAELTPATLEGLDAGRDWPGREEPALSDQPILDFAASIGVEPQAEEKAGGDDLMMLDLPIDLMAGLDEGLSEIASEAESDDVGVGEPVVLSDMPSFELPNIDLALDDVTEASGEKHAFEVEDLADIDLNFSQEEISVTLPQDVPPVGQSDALLAEDIDLDFDFNMDAGPAPSGTLPESVSATTPIDLDLEMGAAASDLDFSSEDPVQTKIDLARAYIDMGDVEGAREILQEAAQEGNPAQQELAKSLLADL